MDNKELIYLATPYTHQDPEVRKRRLDLVNKAAAALMQQGIYVYSPISHTAAIAIENDLPTNWEFWGGYCEKMLEVCDKVIVFTQEGWKESAGVMAEIEIAKELGLPIEYKSAQELKN